MGLFDTFKFCSVPVKAVLGMSVVSGVVYTLLYWVKYRHVESDLFTQFSGVTIASTFWFYKQPHDNIILTIPCLALLYKANSVRDKKQTCRYAFFCVIVASFYAQGALQHVIAFLKLPVSRDVAVSMGKTLQRIVLMVCGGDDLKWKQGVAIANCCPLCYTITNIAKVR